MCIIENAFRLGRRVCGQYGAEGLKEPVTLEAIYICRQCFVGAEALAQIGQLAFREQLRGEQFRAKPVVRWQREVEAEAINFQLKADGCRPVVVAPEAEFYRKLVLQCPDGCR